MKGTVCDTSPYAKNKFGVLLQSLLESKKRTGYMTERKRRLTVGAAGAEGCSGRRPFLLGQPRTGLSYWPRRKVEV